MKTGNENILNELVKTGELTIDSEGKIWKTRKGLLVRAEHKTPLGYLQVRKMIEGIRYHAGAHRVVWLHFKGEIPPGLTINHKNGIKDDNRPENLEIMNYSQQTRHVIDILHKHQRLKNQSGQKNHMAKLTAQAIVEIRENTEAILREMKSRHGHLIMNLARKHGVSYQAIWDVVKNRRWASIL